MLRVCGRIVELPGIVSHIVEFLTAIIVKHVSPIAGAPAGAFRERYRFCFAVGIVSFQYGHQTRPMQVLRNRLRCEFTESGIEINKFRNGRSASGVKTRR